VTLSDDRTLEAKLIGRDRHRQSAVPAAQDHQGLKQLSIGDSDKLQVGDFVVAIGSPSACARP